MSRTNYLPPRALRAPCVPRTWALHGSGTAVVKVHARSQPGTLHVVVHAPDAHRVETADTGIESPALPAGGSVALALPEPPTPSHDD